MSSDISCLDFNPSCPSGGSFHVCTSGSRFVGCCRSLDPCSDLGCSDGNIEPASFDASAYGTFSDQECPTGSSFYACADADPPFMGCCQSNPCNEGCPDDDLTQAFLSPNSADWVCEAESSTTLPVPSLIPPTSFTTYLATTFPSQTASSSSRAVSSSSSTSTSTVAADTDTDAPQSTDHTTTIVGAAVGAGGGALVLALIAFFFYRHRRNRRLAAKTTTTTTTPSTSSNTPPETGTVPHEPPTSATSQLPYIPPSFPSPHKAPYVAVHHRHPDSPELPGSPATDALWTPSSRAVAAAAGKATVHSPHASVDTAASGSGSGSATFVGSPDTAWSQLPLRGWVAGAQPRAHGRGGETETQHQGVGLGLGLESGGAGGGGAGDEGEGGACWQQGGLAELDGSERVWELEGDAPGHGGSSGRTTDGRSVGWG
ncbi:hypothetical protein BDY21DRAFT_191238 [Lineolata rhizophorae]|uniref:Uncharacterized protein n=1 Tax=Lineolata rhizophorae TaxID=578093 RepID=A0A6A6P6V0_9PEZI|nr:hypothetical protein BDY21DRAFT_191238 [Lineolata rhizophorae]